MPKAPRKKKPVKKANTPDEVRDRIRALPKPKNPIKLGRPTTYNGDIPQAAVDYFTMCWENIQEVERNDSKVGVLQYVQKPTEIPTMEGLAMVIGVNTDTLYEWASVHPPFSDALKLCRNLTVRCTHKLTTFGGMPPALGIFTLKNSGKWTDKHEVELGGPITLNFDSQDGEA